MGSYKVLSMIHFGILFSGRCFHKLSNFCRVYPRDKEYLCVLVMCFLCTKKQLLISWYILPSASDMRIFWGWTSHSNPCWFWTSPMFIPQAPSMFVGKLQKKWSPILVRKVSSVIRGEWIILVWKPILFDNSKLVCTVSVWPSLTTLICLPWSTSKPH